MTDPMELVGRLDKLSGVKHHTMNIHRKHLAEAAACIRELVDRIDSLETQIDNLYFEPTEN